MIRNILWSLAAKGADITVIGLSKRADEFAFLRGYATFVTATYLLSPRVRRCSTERHPRTVVEWQLCWKMEPSDRVTRSGP